MFRKFHPCINGNCENKTTHIVIDDALGRPCDPAGNEVDETNLGSWLPPFHSEHPASNIESEDWKPFESKTQFELAEFLYAKCQMSEGNVDELFHIWNKSGFGTAPFSSHQELFNAIDSVEVGDIPWQSFSVQYRDENDDESGDDDGGSDRPQWMIDQHEVFYRDPRLVVRRMLSNPDFCKEMDYSPYREYNKDDDREYHNLMSANWAWEQAVRISFDFGNFFVNLGS